MVTSMYTINDLVYAKNDSVQFPTLVHDLQAMTLANERKMGAENKAFQDLMDAVLGIHDSEGMTQKLLEFQRETSSGRYRFRGQFPNCGHQRGRGRPSEMRWNSILSG